MNNCVALPVRKAPEERSDEPKRFYIFAAPSVVLELQKEAVSRSVNPWELGGLVIQQWIDAGCPDRIQPREDGSHA